MPAPLSLNALASRLFTPRWTALARSRLDGEARRGLGHRVAAPRLGVFPARPGPVRVGGVTVAQPDGVTCAATGLLLLNAACDPRLEDWLATGEVPGTLPPEIAGLAPDQLHETDVARRVAAAAAAVHRRATRATPGPVPRPRADGTPPGAVPRAGGAGAPPARARARARPSSRAAPPTSCTSPTSPGASRPRPPRCTVVPPAPRAARSRGRAPPAPRPGAWRARPGCRASSTGTAPSTTATSG